VFFGTVPNRREINTLLGELESTPVATPDEVLHLVERHKLSGRGCGFVDMSLLASALLSDQVHIWTVDKRLELMTSELNRAYRAALHS
jgi:hypothetical protein